MFAFEYNLSPCLRVLLEDNKAEIVNATKQVVFIVKINVNTPKLVLDIIANSGTCCYFFTSLMQRNSTRALHVKDYIDRSLCSDFCNALGSASDVATTSTYYESFGLLLALRTNK